MARRRDLYPPCPTLRSAGGLEMPLVATRLTTGCGAACSRTNPAAATQALQNRRLANMRAQGVRSLWVVCEPPRSGTECGRLWRCRAGACLRPTDGVHELRRHWRVRPSELAGAPDAREPDRSAVAGVKRTPAHRAPGRARAFPGKFDQVTVGLTLAAWRR